MGDDAGGLEVLAGGYSGETYVTGSGADRRVVRVYAHRGAERGDAAVEVDAAVLRLVRGLLPVPEVLEVTRPDAATGTPARLVTSFLPGEALDRCWDALSPAARVAAGAGLGTVLARLAQMPLPRGGLFVDGDLRVEPWPEGASLPGFVVSQRETSALAEWPEAAYEGVLALARTAHELLVTVDRTCLVHADVNPKNVLVDPASGAVTGLLDWEFAHAGAPFGDLGNLLRFDREPAFADAVLDAYLGLAGHLDGLGSLPAEGARRRALDLARASDLLALVELAGRPVTNQVTERAAAQLHAMAAGGDLHATA